MNEVLLNQLIGMKSQLDALYIQLDTAISLIAGQEPCQHPPDKRERLGMGSKSWRCKVCGYLGGD